MLELAQELTTASTEYAPIPGTDPVQYMQPSYALRLVQAIRKANSETLETLSVLHTHKDLPGHLPLGSTLLQLANLARETENGWPVFMALWRELTTAGHHRRPILFALDGLSHAMRVSDYRSPAYELIHAHDLALVRLFADLMSGATPLPNGGAVIAATSRGNAPRSPSMDLALAQREAAQAGVAAAEAPQPEPYGKGYDERVDAVLRDVDVVRLSGLNKTEARALMEYWAASGLLRTTVDEAAVTQSWALGGNGVVGEMERAALLHMGI
jgi:small subunit ribosomal protein S29